MNNINKTEVIMKKKNFIKALFGTIVLVSAMLFTGCTSDDNIDGTIISMVQRTIQATMLKMAPFLYNL